jgi:hypothetical protein
LDTPDDPPDPPDPEDVVDEQSPLHTNMAAVISKAARITCFHIYRNLLKSVFCNSSLGVGTA